MSNSEVISLPAFLRKLPVFFSGMPKRVKGLYIASRNNDQVPVGLGLCLERATATNPRGIALVFEERELSYTEFNAWVNRIADYLSTTGTQKGDVIAVFIENRPELLACIAAVAKLGAVAALVNTSQQGAALEHSIKLVSPSRIIAGEELMPSLKTVKGVMPKGTNAKLYFADCDTLNEETTSPKGWVNLAASIQDCQSENPASTQACRVSDPCIYFYTSGTTGLPKAAVLTHGRFMKAFGGVGIASIQLKPHDRVYVTLPFYHGTALIVGWGSVLAGAAGLVMARKFSASQFWPEVRRRSVTAICYVGELCRYLLAQPESHEDTHHRVRLIFGNGLRPNIWKAFKSRFGIETVLEFYGSSEGNVGFMNLFNFDCTVGFTTVPYAIVEYDLDLDAPVKQQNGFLSKVKKGEAGLLLGEITDNTPFDGYTDPEKTEKTILRDVFKHGDAWFNTGDLMRHQGFNHAQFVDRLGDTFRWKGENVSTTEVENTLGVFPQIIEAVAYGVEIPNTNGNAGMACIRLEEDESLDAKKLYTHLSSQLPPYAVPVFLRIVDKMETTGTFKYKKVDLKKAGFDIRELSDPIWVCLPGEKCYQTLDKALLMEIVKGKYRY